MRAADPQRAAAPPDYEHILAAGEALRVAKFDSAFPVLFVEATPGAGVTELLHRWADESDITDLRTIIRADKIHAGAGDLARALLTWLRQIVPGPLPDPDSDRVDQLVTLLPRLRRPLAVAITEADFLDPAAFADLAQLVSRRDSVRLIVSGFDCSPLMSALHAADLPYSRLDDDDFAYSHQEVVALLAREGLDTDQAPRIRRLSRGLPGIIQAAIVHGRIAGDEGTQLDPGEFGAYLFTTGVQFWPSPLVSFVQIMAHVPRFTVLEAATIAQTTVARGLIGRLVMLGMGRITFHPSLRQQVFTWFESTRLVALAYVESNEDERARDARRRRTLDAARECLDPSLSISTLVALGQLDDAEAFIADCLWDSLPNGYLPVFDPLIQLDIAKLVSRPHLLALRVRVDRRERLSPAVQRAVLDAITELNRNPAVDPWDRLGQLALIVEFSRVQRDSAALIPLMARLRELVADLSGTVPRAPAAVVSNLLLVAEAALRLGNQAVAAEFAEYAIDVIDIGSLRADPSGERRAVAGRIALVSRRERGLPDPPDAAQLTAAPQFRWREVDLLAQALCMCWEEIDAGDMVAAADTTGAALSRMANPLQWPSLWYQHLWVLGLGQQRERAEQAVQRYFASCVAVGLPTDRPDRVPQALREVTHVVGQYVSTPDFLERGDGVTGSFQRWQFCALLLQALAALRAGRSAEVRHLLTRAIDIAVPRPLSSTILTVALPDEIRALAEIISGHPQAEVLHLDHALAIAGQVAAAVELSDREAQVLDLLRRGMTNAQMAEQLFVTVNTIKFHRGNLMRKLGSSTRQQLLEAAAKAGL